MSGLKGDAGLVSLVPHGLTKYHGRWELSGCGGADNPRVSVVEGGLGGIGRSVLNSSTWHPV
jgi:hypothetical protein